MAPVIVTCDVGFHHQRQLVSSLHRVLNEHHSLSLTHTHKDAASAIILLALDWLMGAVLVRRLQPFFGYVHIIGTVLKT